MATATITISDAENDKLSIKVELDPPVEKDEQVQDARAVATRFLQWLQEQFNASEDENADKDEIQADPDGTSD